MGNPSASEESPVFFKLWEKLIDWIGPGYIYNERRARFVRMSNWLRLHAVPYPKIFQSTTRFCKCFYDIAASGTAGEELYLEVFGRKGLDPSSYNWWNTVARRVQLTGNEPNGQEGLNEEGEN